MNTNYLAVTFTQLRTVPMAYSAPMNAEGNPNTIPPLEIALTFLPVPEKTSLKPARKKKQKFR